MAMTNLQRWILYLLLFVVPYSSLLFAAIKYPSNEGLLLSLQFLPYVMVLTFGLYSVVTVLYRTLTFNNCPEAAKELHEQIQEARKDLLSLGFQFTEQ